MIFLFVIFSFKFLSSCAGEKRIGWIGLSGVGRPVGHLFKSSTTNDGLVSRRGCLHQCAVADTKSGHQSARRHRRLQGLSTFSLVFFPSLCFFFYICVLLLVSRTPWRLHWTPGRNPIQSFCVEQRASLQFSRLYCVVFEFSPLDDEDYMIGWPNKSLMKFHYLLTIGNLSSNRIYINID